ncbi:hypothetical protein HPB48_002740 [Haemaphysalis longicornis]|uniref:Uncharacterized protein n=1 Tax=Haemaphysalis longicornis TaxID=44386 RepID=A0A9J6GQJ6_HAELO|nr:hypothetical protein HPB48_002740 [Haemaphysalis longicornis]
MAKRDSRRRRAQQKALQREPAAMIFNGKVTNEPFGYAGAVCAHPGPDVSSNVMVHNTCKGSVVWTKVPPYSTACDQRCLRLRLPAYAYPFPPKKKKKHLVVQLDLSKTHCTIWNQLDQWCFGQVRLDLRWFFFFFYLLVSPPLNRAAGRVISPRILFERPFRGVSSASVGESIVRGFSDQLFTEIPVTIEMGIGAEVNEILGITGIEALVLLPECQAKEDADEACRVDYSCQVVCTLPSAWAIGMHTGKHKMLSRESHCI